MDHTQGHLTQLRRQNVLSKADPGFIDMLKDPFFSPDRRSIDFFAINSTMQCWKKPKTRRPELQLAEWRRQIASKTVRYPAYSKAVVTTRVVSLTVFREDPSNNRVTHNRRHRVMPRGMFVILFKNNCSRIRFWL